MTWVRARLGDVCTLKRGYDLPETRREAGEVPVVSSAGITGFHNEKKATAPGVVTGRYGTLGEVFYLEKDYWPLNTALYVSDFKGNYPRFVAYFLKHALRGGSGDKAAVPGVNRNDLHELAIRYPKSTTTQERIAEILGAHDELVEVNSRRMALLEEAARLLYDEWIVRLRFPGHERVRVRKGLPDGWERRPLAKCGRFLSGGTPSKARAEYWEGSIPWVSSGELTALRIHRTELNITDEAAAEGSRVVPANTILAVVRGMSLAKEFRIGLTASEMAFNQDLKAIVSAPDVDPLLLFQSLDAQRDQIRDRASDASHGTKKLDSAVLEQLEILVPSEDVQQRFREKVEAMHSLWDVLDNQNEQLRSAKNLLLPRLMNGELDV
jgi:type I restriction enzyme S subunit